MLNRAQYVLTNTQVFARAMVGLLSFENLREFAEHAEDTAREKSREYTRKVLGDELVLTNHGDHVRRLASHIMRLRDELIPALDIDRRNPALHTEAVCEMAFIRSEFEAMDLRLQ